MSLEKGCPATPVIDIASRPCEAVNCHHNYQKIAFNYYGNSIMKLNNFSVVIISVLFLHSTIGDDDYHKWTPAEIIH